MIPIRYGLIVPTFNSGEPWCAFLASLGRQSLQPHRKLIIDSCSDDQTVVLASQAGFEDWRDGKHKAFRFRRKLDNYWIQLLFLKFKIAIQSEIERLRTKNWTQLQIYSSGEYFTPQGEFIKQFSEDYIAYRYVIPITGGQQLLIAVRVEWTTEKGRQSTRWFNTIFTKDGLNDYYYRDI